MELETELLRLHEKELLELRAVGARVAAREQRDWEDEQVRRLVRPHSAAPALGGTANGTYNRLHSPPRPQSARRRAPDGSPSDHLSSSAISDLRAELAGLPYNSGRPGSARRAAQLLEPSLPLPAQDPSTVTRLQALASAQASSEKDRHKALRERRRLRAMAAQEAAAAERIKLAWRCVCKAFCLKPLKLTSKACVNRKSIICGALTMGVRRTMEPSSLPVFITTGCDELDELLGGGGLETGKVTEISGHPDTMLRLCHALCVTTQLPMVATARADSSTSADVGRHYGLKVFGGANGKVMVIDALGTFLAPLIGGSVAAEKDCESGSGATSPRDDDTNAEEIHTTTVPPKEQQQFEDVDEALQSVVAAVEQQDPEPLRAATEQWDEGTEGAQEKNEEEDEGGGSELSVLGALCGRFELDMATALDRITYSCTCDADRGAMNTEDEAELLAQAKMLLEDASCDDGDDDEWFELAARGRGNSSRWSNRYRCLIIHQPSHLLRDWSDASREGMLESVAACAIAQGAAVCFVNDKDEDEAASEVTVCIRYNVSGTRSSKPLTGRIDKGRSVFSDIFDTTHRDPETDAAVAATVESLVAAIEDSWRKALEEEAAQAKMAAKISAAKQLLRVSEVRDRQVPTMAAESYAEEIALTALASECAPQST